MRAQINAALKVIRDVMPEVTAAEIRNRSSAYSRIWPDVSVSAMALAKHWASLGEKKEGAAARVIKAADFPWRTVAIVIEEWTPEGTWEQQTARSRSQLREVWDGLPPERQAELQAMKTGEKKEEGGGAEAA